MNDIYLFNDSICPCLSLNQICANNNLNNSVLVFTSNYIFITDE